MSVLTKVFVVLVTVLSILLVALIVPFVANTDDFRKDAAEARKEAAVHSSGEALKQSVIESLQSNQSETIKGLTNAKTNLETQLNGLNTQLAKAEAEALEAKAGQAKAAADFSHLTAAELQNAEINKAQAAELAQRRSEMTDLQTKTIELGDRIKEIDSQRQALERERKRDAEMVVELQDKLAKSEAVASRGPAAAGGPNAAAGTTPAPFEPENPIQGQVTKVQKVEGDTFVEINVGKNDGVEENMKFMIHRGDQYLGSLVVTFVDAKAASGRMQLERGPIAAGDQVLTGGR